MKYNISLARMFCIFENNPVSKNSELVVYMLKTATATTMMMRMKMGMMMAVAMVVGRS